MRCDLITLEGIHGAGHGEIGLAGAGRADAEADVVFLDLAQILHLMRRAAVQIGAPRQQASSGLGGGVHALVRGSLRQLHHAQLNFLYAQGMAGKPVKMLQRRGGMTGPPQLTADAHVLAAPGDGDITGGFNLSQVFVEGATQVRQPQVVQRCEGDGERLGFDFGHGFFARSRQTDSRRTPTAP
jgi:hypothetical protein